MSKNTENNRKHQNTWFQNNKELKRKRVAERRQELVEWLTEIKRTKSCVFCGHSGKESPKSLSFHHIDPSTKTLEVSQMVRNGYSKERILNEISLCYCLCENCHRKIHLFYLKRVPLREWYVNFKKELICEECGEKDWRCLELHHVDSSTKVESVAKMVNDTYPFETICDEIAKTKCLCANCHRKG